MLAGDPLGAGAPGGLGGDGVGQLIGDLADAVAAELERLDQVGVGARSSRRGGRCRGPVHELRGLVAEGVELVLDVLRPRRPGCVSSSKSALALLIGLLHQGAHVAHVVLEGAAPCASPGSPRTPNTSSTSTTTPAPTAIPLLTMRVWRSVGGPAGGARRPDRGRAAGWSGSSKKDRIAPRSRCGV